MFSAVLTVLARAARLTGAPFGRRMPARPVVFLACALWLSPASAALDGTAADLEAYLAGVQTLSARFHQTVIDERGNPVEQAEGDLLLLRPGRFRWDYSRPYVQQIVSNGEVLWMYDQDLEQVTVHTARQALRSTPAELLSGNRPLTESFALTNLGQRDGQDWVLLQPTAADTGYSEVRVGLRDGALSGMELKDALGQLTRLSFSAVQRNIAVDPAQFEFEPPAGVEVVDNRQQ